MTPDPLYLQLQEYAEVLPSDKRLETWGTTEHSQPLLTKLHKAAQLDARRQRHNEPLVSVDVGLRIRAGARVGFVVAGDAWVEVYPKYVAPASEDWTCVRAGFVDLLRYSRMFDLWPGLDCAVAADSRISLPEWVLRGIAQTLIAALDRGIPRSYVEHPGALLAVRGRIDLGEQVRKAHGLDIPIHCRFDEHLTDSPVLRLLALLAEVLLARCRTHNTRGLALQARRRLVEVTASVAPDVDFVAVRWTRLDEHFKPSVQALMLLLGGQGQQHERGKSPSWSISVPMEVVFERYAAQLLREVKGGLGAAVRTQDIVGHLSKSPRMFKQIPDLVLSTGSTTTIIDTKYKVPENMKPSEADVRQVLTYAALWNQQKQDPPCTRVVLLYPRGFGEPVPTEKKWASFMDDGANGAIEIVATTLPFGRRPRSKEIAGFIAAPNALMPGILWPAR